jgi:glycosyltransferase involved in cell wall biosynthesis
VRIGLVTTSFPRDEGDSAGRFVLGFARALAARGHTLDVLAPEPDDERYRAPPDFPGIELSWVSYLPRRWERTFYRAGVLDNLRRDPWAALGIAPFTLALAQAVRTRAARWDAVVSHWALPSAWIVGELVAAPHLAVLHSADVFLLEKLPLRARLAARIASRAQALLFSTRDLRRRFLALLAPVERANVASRAHVCAMGVEPRDEHDVPGARPSERFTVLSLGRLVAIKGVEHAIRAVATLSDVELVIAGDGPERARLTQLAEALRAPVRFVGAVHGAQKRALFAAAHCFVLPSVVLPSGRSEGMPTTILEAMEHGLPVIASDVGGVSDVVHDAENGLLVAQGDALAITHAIGRLRDPSLRTQLARAARETAALYHWSNLAPRFEALLTHDG